MKERKFNSWLGRVFGYVRLLETLVQDQAEQLDEKEAQLEKIQDRLIRLTTGFGMKEEMPNMVELQREQEEMLKRPRTVEDLSLQLEAESERAVKERYAQEAEAARQRRAAAAGVDLAAEEAAATARMRGKNGQ